MPGVFEQLTVLQLCYSSLMVGIDMPTTTIRLPAEMKERVAKVAAWSGKTSHALILDAITSRLDEEEYRNDFYTTAEKRFDEIIATGKTLRS